MKLVTNPWAVHRSAITAADFPSTAAKNPVANPATDRLVSCMVSYTDVAVTPISLQNQEHSSTLFLRFRFGTASAYADFQLFGAVPGDLSVHYLGTLRVTAGTQHHTDATHFGCVSSNKTIYAFGIWAENATAESGTGIYMLALETFPFDRLWVGISAISAGSVTVEYTGTNILLG